MFKRALVLVLIVGVGFPVVRAAAQMDLSKVRVVTAGDEELFEVPCVVLIEEVAKRTGITWSKGEQVGGEGAITLRKAAVGDGVAAEGFKISTEVGATPRITVSAASRRGALFGVGYLLRKLDWGPRKVSLTQAIAVTEAPQYAIRGHQLGYRAQANSYDAWDEKTYDQYIRELTFFGANCIENIPFQDARPTPIMPLSREEMNRRLSAICDKYDVDYWVWTPADFDLKDAEKRAAAVRFHEQFYQDCPRLDAIFFPGGDPGDNHPREVMPFLEDLSKILPKYHPNAKIWMSLQGFEGEKTDYFFDWLDEHKPDWLGGLVAGPSSPPLPEMRARLDKRYKLRDYPDITHIVRAQYEALNLDQVFALTAGREPINPRPEFYAEVFAATAPSTDGFLSYSDGCHDDLNKALWSGLSWNPRQETRAILVDYARCFFGSAAERVADGIFALEKNWAGSLRTNEVVPATLKLWQDLEAAHPELKDNWRWQMLVVRAYYDAYQRERLIRETALEQEACEAIEPKEGRPPTEAMRAALKVLERVETEPTRPELRDRIIELFDHLYTSIKFQSSVEKYHAIHPQRGCMLDFLDYPLNNRFWLEDEFHKVATLPTLEARWARLEQLRTWENPGPGSYYDDIGHVGRSPHVVRSPEQRGDDATFWWWDNGMSRLRLSWLVTSAPNSLEYDHLDPNASYLLRFCGFGELKPRADEQALTATVYHTEAHTMKEFPVPPELIKDGKLTVTFDNVQQPGVNWRNQPRLAEAWLLKNPAKDEEEKGRRR
ncbi:MAG: hypothetical protein HY706_22500 [Candidatus Hydrogenedentes bacterium]|nr:hypothetical protein [Candidatus Hydrogenedentota bacterium]